DARGDSPRPARPGGGRRPRGDLHEGDRGQPGVTEWKEVLRTAAAPTPTGTAAEIRYVVDVVETLRAHALSVHLYSRSRLKDGSLGKLQPLVLTFGQAAVLPDEADRRALALLRGTDTPDGYWAFGPGFDRIRMPATVAIQASAAAVVLEQLCATKRCFVLRP